MFVYGTQYYRPPNPPADDWARDLALIREHGFNMVKYWIPWTWVHRAPNHFDFSEIDTLMELASHADLKVVLNIILENAPYWMEEHYPEAHYCANDGTVVPLTAAINTPCGGWPGLCLDNEPVREQAIVVLQTVARRYRHHPALFGFDVWNEPHVEPTWYYPDKMFCYCESSIKRFKGWLKTKYGDLDTLNRVWARRYSSWSQVSPPRTFEVYPDLLDWKRFWLENLRAWLDFKTQTVRAIDSHHPLITHAASSGYLGTMPINTWDEWLLADATDIFGTSSFPKWLMKNDPAEYTFHLDIVRGAAKGKPFWQAELQGGHGRDIGYTRTPHPTPAELRIWNWNVLASGASGLLYWCWRPELLGPEAPGYALCNVAGTPTARAAAAAQMAHFIASKPEIGASCPVESEIGIVVSRDTALLNYAGDRNMELYARCLLGAYRAFYDRNIPVALVHVDVLPAAVVEGRYKHLYYPLPLVMDAAVASALKEFVIRGGVLLSEACPGHYDENGWCSTQVPEPSMVSLFGAQEIETDRVGRIEIRLTSPIGLFRGESVPVTLYREGLRIVTGDARVLGAFSDGTPAIVHNAFGQGHAYLVGSLPSLLYEEIRDPTVGELITAFRYLNAKPHAAVNPPETSLRTRIHQYADGYLVYVLNWGDEERQVELHFNGLDLGELRVSPNAAIVDATSAQLTVGAMDGLLLSMQFK